MEITQNYSNNGFFDESLTSSGSPRNSAETRRKNHRPNGHLFHGLQRQR